MNNRQILHAGNFADVLKHAALVRIVAHLKENDTAFRVVDTHAGAGLYDLTSDEVQEAGEWHSGIGRLLEASLPADADRLLEPYLSIIRTLNPDSTLSCYPGSPILVRELFRKQDRLSAIELHPQDGAALKSLFDGDYQTRVTALDGWLALGAHLPPKEQRGVVLVDPPFEAEGEYDRLVDGLARAYGRWPSGLYCLWYPIRDGAPIAAFHRKLRALGVANLLCAELHVCDAKETNRLSGSGVIFVNMPTALEDELAVLLPALEVCLAQTPQSHHSVFRIGESD
ncbi:23S rRNA (adenine(2030)-N(6))-methyltransferase RlmJ [Hoeflea sp.]|uniref:23S rRNA (adenine(2030)-N(6))-methyltransferase RlmJ n=1 Tax=Hoeflea sp. TaxID=1940281 RepID=UPI003B01A728